MSIEGISNRLGDLSALILAAGQGKRMKSPLPKVLHPLCGLPMLHYVIDAAFQAGAAHVVAVVGHGKDQVQGYVERVFGERVVIAHQEQQLGTGDAARAGLCALGDNKQVLILCGDTPLLDAAELRSLRELMDEGALLGMLTSEPEDPRGYGRILRNEQNEIVGIREERDCSPAELRIREVNSGVYLANSEFLKEALLSLSPQNAQGELYLTDIVAMAARKKGVRAHLAKHHGSLAGINDRAQLAAAEDILYHRIADAHRLNGISIRTGARIDAQVRICADALIEHGVVLRGATQIGAGAIVDVGCVLTDVEVEAGARVKPYSVCEKSKIGQRAQIGPFSHLRPESEIESDAHIGNFVETKKTRVRKGAKANHLAYLGDGDIGEGANIGAGTIFCNYDGFKKHKTEIGEGAFIGSDSQIVAPVRIGKGAYVATGTTVTRDVPENALAISRTKQENKEGYASRLRARLKGG